MTYNEPMQQTDSENTPVYRVSLDPVLERRLKHAATAWLVYFYVSIVLIVLTVLATVFIAAAGGGQFW